MSKTILVLDEIPRYCSECMFCRKTITDDIWRFEKRTCLFTDHTIHHDTKRENRDCPLKELPEKQVRDYPEYDKYTTGYDDGWDACLDEIIGE